MAILNYTTQIPVEKSIAEIQKCLVAHGATAILCDYKDGFIVAISFKMRVGDIDSGFRLPTVWEPILSILKRDPKVPKRLHTQEQALRVAWRIIKDWVEAQMAIVETKMVTTDQVFLPYVVMKNGQTLYDHVKNSPLLLQ